MKSTRVLVSEVLMFCAMVCFALSAVFALVNELDYALLILVASAVLTACALVVDRPRYNR